MVKGLLKSIWPIILIMIVASVGFISFFGWPTSNREMKPIPILYGKDVCTRCQMSIVNKKFACEAGNPNTGVIYKFDSFGCLAEWLYVENNFSWANQAKVWVHDYYTDKWINGKTAHWFKVNPGLDPMGFGLVATDKNVSDSFDYETAVKMADQIQKKIDESIKKMNEH